VDKRAQLTHLQGELNRGIRQIFDTALSVEEGAGVTPEWQALCAHYGVSLVSDEERTQIRAAQRPELGAAVMEFQQVVDKLVRWLRIQTKQVDVWDAPDDVERTHEKLLRLLDRISNELGTAYRGTVLPKPKGMFGNALMHHDPNAKSSWDKARAHSLRCTNCGAPRLKTTDLICAFCDKQMAGA